MKLLEARMWGAKPKAGEIGRCPGSLVLGAYWLVLIHCGWRLLVSTKETCVQVLSRYVAKSIGHNNESSY